MKKIRLHWVVMVLFSVVLAGCEKEELKVVEDVAQNQSTEESNVALRSAVAYKVTISGPTTVLIKGNTVTITGLVTDGNGKAYAKKSIGVEDGIKLYSTTTTTDASGKINYQTKVNATGVAVVTFIVNNQRFPFVFQAASKKSGGIYYTTGLIFSSLKIANSSGKNYSVKTKISNGRSYTQTIKKNATQTILSSVSNTLSKRVTAFAGATFIVGAGAGGDISASIDTKGNTQISVSVGALLLRGQAYVSNNTDFGICWAPGGDLGYGPIAVSAEAVVCLGSDGINVGGSLGSSNFVGGININLVAF